MLLFPDGRLPSRRWRIVAWMAVLGAVLTALGMLSCRTFDSPTVTLKTLSESRGYIGGRFTTYDFFGASRLVGETLLLTSSLAALFSLVLRLRRASGR